MLLLLAAICFLIAKIFFPEFYSNTITLTLAGDVDSLSRYISSFGYGAFAVSLFLLILCNVFGIPTIPFQRRSFRSSAGDHYFLDRRSYRD